MDSSTSGSGAPLKALIQKGAQATIPMHDEVHTRTLWSVESVDCSHGTSN